jgi:fluoroquinolone transport system permease protein
MGRAPVQKTLGGSHGGKIMKRLATLLVSEAKSTVRDEILIILACTPVMLTFLIRFGEPLLRNLLDGLVDLSRHHGTIVAVLTSMTPMMFGWLIGFKLLDDRDEHTLSAIAVTPLTKRGYLVYRTILVLGLSALLNTVLIPLTGLRGIVFTRFIPVSLMASLEAPVTALILAAFAGNKVEGLAVAKFMGILSALPVLPFYITSPFIFAAGITPFFWVGKALSLSGGPFGPYITAVAAGFAVHVAYLALFLSIFNRRVEW